MISSPSTSSGATSTLSSTQQVVKVVLDTSTTTPSSNIVDIATQGKRKGNDIQHYGQETVKKTQKIMSKIFYGDRPKQKSLWNQRMKKWSELLIQNTISGVQLTPAKEVYKNQPELHRVCAEDFSFWSFCCWWRYLRQTWFLFRDMWAGRREGLSWSSCLNELYKFQLYLIPKISVSAIVLVVLFTLVWNHLWLRRKNRTSWFSKSFSFLHRKMKILLVAFDSLIEKVWKYLKVG